MIAHRPDAMVTQTDPRVRQAVALAAATVKLRKENSHTRYVDDPVGFITGALKEELWSKQVEVAEAVRDHRHVAVPSSHDTGKSFIASRLAAWWLACHEPGEAFVVSSAPSFAQVRAILWREIHRAHKRGKLPGTVNQTEWWIDGEIVAYGRKPADYDDDAFQGIHSRYVLVILDEACGIPPKLWTAAETIATNENCRILAIGNPDDPLSEFQKKTKSKLWHTIRIDGLQSPNFTDEVISDSLSELLLSKTWVEERREEWGEGSALWQSKVRGVFPLVPEGAVYKGLSPTQQHYGELPPFKVIKAGVDIGGPNDRDHKSAVVIGGVVGRAANHADQIVPEGTLIRFAHFEHSGPGTHAELVFWLKSWEAKLGRRIQYRVDKSQSLGISMLQQEFHDNQQSPAYVLPTDGSGGSVAAGIELVRDRMAQGSSRFTEELLHVPKFHDGRPMNGKSWYERMSNYRLVLVEDPNKPAKLLPLKRDDDTADADRYLHEAVDGLRLPSGPAVSGRTISGKRLAKKAV